MTNTTTGAQMGIKSRATYDALLEVYRDAPGNHKEVARRLQVPLAFAKTAWSEGWPKLAWARPIRFVCEAERIDAQAEIRRAQIRAEEAAEAAREAARELSVQARKEEDQIVRAARQDVLAALVVSAELVPAMRSLVMAVTEAARSPGLDAAGKPLPPAIGPKDAMKLIAAHTTMVAKSAAAAAQILELSRLDRGASTSNVSVSVGLGPAADGMSMEAAMDELRSIGEVLGHVAHPRALTTGSDHDEDVVDYADDPDVITVRPSARAKLAARPR